MSTQDSSGLFILSTRSARRAARRAHIVIGADGKRSKIAELAQAPR